MTSDSSSTGLAIILFVTVVFLYFLPTLIALTRNHHNAAAIVVTNIFLGWTFLGWVAALIWSFTAAAAEVTVSAVASVASVQPPASRSAPSIEARPEPVPKPEPYKQEAIRDLEKAVQGDGVFGFDIVGESFHDDALEAIMSDRDGPYEAEIVYEDDDPYDAFAVAVTIDGRIVGHFDRSHARLFRDRMAVAAPMTTHFKTQARIKGFPGGMKGVRLDIRLPFRLV